MELILNPTLIINEFEDGDMVIIDQQKEMTHLLNKSAALIITILRIELILLKSVLRYL